MSGTPAPASAPAPSRATPTLTPQQEYVRCTLCGIGATPGTFSRPARHVVTTITEHGTSTEYAPADHEPICDNVGADGRVYSFGRIIDIAHVGPYAIATVERVRVDGSTETAYHSYIDGEQVLDPYWKRSEPGLVSTSHSHDALEDALAFVIAYRFQGPNTAQHVGPHYVAGLRR